MKEMFNGLVNNMLFWMAWIIIPLMMEIVPAIFGSLLLIKKKIFSPKVEEPVKFPEIDIIVPVYNSAKTLMRCIKSINDSDYANELISVIVVNNGSKDDSFEIFCECQQKFSDLSMKWLSSRQGKSKALNMAVFNSHAKYIINIDSDGVLYKDALSNIIRKFENTRDMDCCTGAVLVDSDLVKKTKKFSRKILRQCEMMEYFQAFLAGRNFQAESNSIYTLSGAFSAFRKSTLLKTQLYNTETICEDTQVTFQIKKLLNKKVDICENAFFFVEPIDDFNKLYTQRQRWQRGELEVSHMFLKNNAKEQKNILADSMLRVLLFDHTFAFPRMIWYFALICLMFMNYSVKTIVFSVLILYSLYVIVSILYFLNICMYLKNYKKLRHEYFSKFYILFILPIYNFIVYFIRLAGIINSINTDSTWRTRTLSDEAVTATKIIASDFLWFKKIRKKAKKLVNQD